MVGNLFSVEKHIPCSVVDSAFVIDNTDERLKDAVILHSVKTEGLPVVKLTASSGIEKVRESISEVVRIVTLPFFHSYTC
jgi:hypothetical protein